MITRMRALTQRKFVRDTLVLQAAKLIMVALSLISSVVVWRLLGPDRYGVYALAGSFVALWQTLNLTGIGVSTITRLGIAIGADDHAEIRSLMVHYVQVSLLINGVIFGLILIFGVPAAARLHEDGRIGVLTAWLAFAALADALYNLVIIAFQSRRAMTILAFLQVSNQAVLSLSLIIAALIRADAESLIAARMVYSFGTLALAWIVYIRAGDARFPTLAQLIHGARQTDLRAGWRQYGRFGVANAVDKNIGNLFLQLPMQLVGVLGGSTAAGFLSLAQTGITQAGVLTSAIFDNMTAVIPQRVGKGDYAGLQRDFTRVLLILGAGGLAVYGGLALVAGVVIPPVLGERWIPAIPALIALTPYGAITTVGGVFGPLYRALNQMRKAIGAKLIALVVGVFALLLLSGVDSSVMGASVAGALMIDVIFGVSVLLTVAFTLPDLRRRAKSSEFL